MSFFHTGTFCGRSRAPLTWSICLSAMALLAGCGSSDSPASLAETCAGLSNLMLGTNLATVTEAKVVAATATEPEYCVAQAKFADSALRFEARMPTSGWNGKLAFLGGGGFDGHVPKAGISESIVSERYATLATNGGYDAPPAFSDYLKTEFAYDAVKLADFTHQSEHRSLPLGKELIKAFYGSAPTKSYFEGCSMGGHDAMMQAQRYPLDFDGIVARAPVGNMMGVAMEFNRIAKRVRVAASTLNAQKQTLLANAVLAQCDPLDGVTDGIISKPAACTFDPAALRCVDGIDTGDTCLSDAQIATVTAITTPIASSDGAWSHTGFYFGAENTPKGWGEYIWPSAAFGGDSLQGLLGDALIRSFITRTPGFDTATWNADQWLSEMSLIGAMFNATNPDLSGMQARGAKLIMWNGATDTSASAKDNSKYYDSVVTKMGQANADKVVELFVAPGVGHCGGGVGPDKVDMLKAVATWVEQGTPPSAQNLVHGKVDATGATTLSRPACKYPAYPRYKGAGDPNDAANFTCSTQ